jgi:energy-coupling factor transport system permease protein
MTARGFAGSDEDTALAGPTKLLILIGLMLVAAGWLLRLVWGQPLLGLGLLLLGIGGMAGAIWWAGRRVPRTTYRPQPWTRYEWGIIGGAALAGLAFGVAWPGLDRSSIFYYPYPHLTWPTVQPLLVFATLGLLAPALLNRFFAQAARPEPKPTLTRPTETEYDSV